MADEMVKKDIINIVRLIQGDNLSDRAKVKSVYANAVKQQFFKTAIGDRFLERCRDISEDNPYDERCIICKANPAENGFVCCTCMEKINVAINKNCANDQSDSTEQKNEEASFCNNCGAQITKGAAFCSKCETKVQSESVTPAAEEIETGAPIPQLAPTREKKKLGDGVIDAISSKIMGKKVETIRISLEDMLALLNEHFITPAATAAEYKRIQQVANGGIVGVTRMTSKDGNYDMSVSIMMQVRGRMDLLHPGDSNWIRIFDNTTGKVYQYSSFTWRRFKNAVKEAIAAAQVPIIMEDDITSPEGHPHHVKSAKKRKISNIYRKVFVALAVVVFLPLAVVVLIRSFFYDPDISDIDLYDYRLATEEVVVEKFGVEINEFGYYPSMDHTIIMCMGGMVSGFRMNEHNAEETNFLGIQLGDTIDTAREKIAPFYTFIFTEDNVVEGGFTDTYADNEFGTLSIDYDSETDKIISLTYVAVDLPEEVSGPVAEDHSAEFVGEWWDTWSQRCGMTIESDGINYYINIHWGNTAWDSSNWSFVGTYDNEMGGIAYTGSCFDAHVTDDGEVQETVRYSDGTGFIHIEGDMLYWIDNVEGAGADCVFQRPQDEEIIVPEQTDLMVTDSVGRENLWNVVEGNTAREINLFFSNFAELNFNNYSVNAVDVSSLISFAYLHNNFNYYNNRFNIVEDENGNSYEAVDAGYVSDTIKQFFDLDISPQSTENIGYDSGLNIYYTPAADGEQIYLFAQVTGIYDNGDSTYDVTYDVFYEESYSIPQYAYDRLTDEQMMNLTYNGSLAATIRASDIYDRKTYRLLELYQQY